MTLEGVSPRAGNKLIANGLIGAGAAILLLLIAWAVNQYSVLPSVAELQTAAEPVCTIPIAMSHELDRLKEFLGTQ